MRAVASCSGCLAKRSSSARSIELCRSPISLPKSYGGVSRYRIKYVAQQRASASHFRTFPIPVAGVYTGRKGGCLMQRKRTPFSPKSFLAKVGEGRTIAIYGKKQPIF